MGSAWLTFGFADVAGATPPATTNGIVRDCGGLQAPSNADFTGNGANTSGAYNSTADPMANNGATDGVVNGTASNGKANATGMPSAGCAGKADNKNPPGQAPDGSDPNAGYECDRNQGVGQSNPAHTGCESQPA
jgi:hypothetical protein